MPHLNSAHNTSFLPLAACPFYIIFFGDVTRCAVSRCVWRSYTSLFNKWFFLSFSDFPRFFSRPSLCLQYILMRRGTWYLPPSSSAGVKHRVPIFFFFLKIHCIFILMNVAVINFCLTVCINCYIYIFLNIIIKFLILIHSFLTI